jgi:DNA-binding transcriptional LysR family regulator
MPNFVELVATFQEVASARSFSTAARRLSVSRAAVSQHVARLEQRLGVTLLTRNTRSVNLTDEGRQLLQRTAPLLAEVAALEAGFLRAGGEISGRVRVEMPEFVGVRLVAPRLAPFLEAHPGLQLDLRLNERIDDKPAGSADVYVRGTLPDLASLRYKPLGKFSYLLAASPDYLARHGTPKRPEDLREHLLIDYVEEPSGRPYPWELVPVRARAQTKPVVIDGPMRLMVNNTDAAHAAALGGCGIVGEFEPALRPRIASGELVQVLPGWRSPAYPLYVLWPAGRGVPARVDAVVRFLLEAFKSAGQL